jgi:O-antigen/teichoic acid export membrane protein
MSAEADGRDGGSVDQGSRPPLRRAVMLMTASSFLVPAGGLLTQPVLAQALGVAGRGQLAAALAPGLLTVAVATLGLPDALTYYVAKYPHIMRPSLLRATLVTVSLGLLCVLTAVIALPFLSSGDATLGRLILLGIALAIPSLVVGVFRGAATGLQMWNAVAIERLVNIVSRVVALVVLLLIGRLTVVVALLVTCLAPVIAGLVYWRLLLKPGTAEPEGLSSGMLRQIVSYGNKVWLGSVASMLLSRMAQLLIAPLSSVEDLGIYSVATTISDLPLVVALAIAGALFGINSASRDAGKVTLTSRLTLLVSVVGCAVLGVTAPLWITPLFGAEFAVALVPTLMLLLSAVLCVPGLMAATAIGAWGKPGSRSLGLAVTLVVNVVLLVALVPVTGVIGACWTSIASNVVLTGYMIIVGARALEVPARDFVAIRPSDLAFAWAEGVTLVARLRRRRRSSPSVASPPEPRK